MKLWKNISPYFNITYKGRHCYNACSVCISCDPKSISDISRTCNAMNVLPIGDQDTLPDLTGYSRKLIQITDLDDCTLRGQSIYSDIPIERRSNSISLDCKIKRVPQNTGKQLSNANIMRLLERSRP